MGKWDFSGDEVICFAVSIILGVAGLIIWYGPLARLTRLGERDRIRPLLACTPPFALGGLLFVLITWGDPKYVVGQLDYILLFMAGGLAWMTLTQYVIRLVGLDVRDDAIERRNPAAAIAAAAAVLASMILYAAANVGSGPTIWTTIDPGAMAAGAWFALWVIVELLTRISEQIAIERDPAAAIRHGAWLIATALVLGRAVAGDWTGWDETWGDLLHLGWPALLLAAIVVPMHWGLRPTRQSPRRDIFTAALAPGLILLAFALCYLVLLGRPDIGKHVITYEQYTGNE